jgi:anaerobic dimethyl sulfoxide reductase subunit B (iron-sulfur subunit)
MACKDKHDLPMGQLWRRVYEVAGGDWQPSGAAWTQSVFAYHLSLACNHCENPICAEVCPTGAMHARPDGIVLVDADRCIGCHYCAWVCPYGAPQYDATLGVMGKCHLCHDELDAGRPPACVAACPLRVLEFGELDQLRAAHGTLAEIYPLPGAERTRPALVITPHPSARRESSRSAAVVNREEVGRGRR